MSWLAAIVVRHPVPPESAQFIFEEIYSRGIMQGWNMLSDAEATIKGLIAKGHRPSPELEKDLYQLVLENDPYDEKGVWHLQAYTLLSLPELPAQWIREFYEKISEGRDLLPRRNENATVLGNAHWLMKIARHPSTPKDVLLKGLEQTTGNPTWERECAIFTARPEISTDPDARRLVIERSIWPKALEVLLPHITQDEFAPLLRRLVELNPSGTYIQLSTEGIPAQLSWTEELTAILLTSKDAEVRLEVMLDLGLADAGSQPEGGRLLARDASAQHRPWVMLNNAKKETQHREERAWKR